MSFSRDLQDNPLGVPLATNRRISRRNILPTYIAASCSSDSRSLKLEDIQK